MFHDRVSERVLLGRLGGLIFEASSVLLEKAHELARGVDSLSACLNDEEPHQPPDWAGYKRLERGHEAIYRRGIDRQLRNRMRSLRPLFDSGPGRQLAGHQRETPLDLARLLGIREISTACFDADFAGIIAAGPGQLFPWWQHVASNLKEGPTSFSTMSALSANSKLDLAMRFKALVELCHNGYVDLFQTKPFGSISIQPGDRKPRSDVVVRDETGALARIEWSGLNPKQRQKVIEDLASRRIILAPGDSSYSR